MLGQFRNRKAGGALRRPAADARNGRALILEARLLLLDEPTLGLAPNSVKEIFRSDRACAKGQTILMVEQNAKPALDISD